MSTCQVTNSKGQECGREVTFHTAEGVCGAHQHRMDRDGTYDADRPIRTYTKNGLNRTGVPVPGSTPREKFFARIEVDGDHWLWTGPTANRRGVTGIFDPGVAAGPPLSAHKFAWTLVNGPVPEGVIVKVTCGTPRCTNPAHVELLGATSEMLVAA